MKKFKFIILLFLMIMTLGILSSCGDSEGQVGPVGPQGEPGIQGEKGDSGEPRNDGVGVESIKLTSSEGLVDTYTITFTNGDTTTFTVTNGKDGIDGIDGEKGEDGHTPVITIKDGYWYIDGENTNVLAEGLKGNTGNDGVNGLSAFEIFKKYYPEYIGTEEEWIYAVATNDVCSLLGHKVVVDEAVESTCTTDGLTEGSHCSICEEIFVEQYVVEASHKFAGTVCSVCGFNSETNGFEYVLSEDGMSYCISSYDGNDTDVIIPAMYNGKPVIGINQYFLSRNEFVESITISEGIKNIGFAAFSDCISLKTLIIPDSIISIDNAAFAGCTSLTSIVIGSGLEELGNSAFYDCHSVVSVSVSPQNQIFDSRNNCNAIIKTSNNMLVKGFACSIIPNTVEIIGDSAFIYCKMSSIEIPKSITRIDFQAFVGCDDLKTVYYCGTKKQWNEIDINNGFGANQQLLDATLICTGTENGDFIYESNGDGTSSIVGFGTTVSIPSETPNGEVINRIASYSFSNIENLIVEIPSSIQIIDDYALYNCEIKEIRFSGTCQEWYNLIKSDGYWNYNGYNFEVVCTDGSIWY